MLPLFTILKSLHLTSQPACLKKITSVQRRGCLPQKNRVFEAPTRLSSHKSDNNDHENPLGPNNSPTRLLETPTPKIPIDVARYTKKNLKQII